MGIAVRGLLLWVAVALVFWVVVLVLPGFEGTSFRAALFATGMMSLLTVVLWPIVIRIVLPLTVVTFGLASLALNAGLVMLALEIVDENSPSFLEALGASFLLSLALMVLGPAFSFDDDARQLRIVRRRARRVREENRTDVPGVILFEIDGLAEPILRKALAEGHAPVMKRWLEDGSHRLMGWECDLSSQTGASQAGLLLGSNEDMPAFRWYEKETGQTMVSNHGKDAVEIERRRSDGGGLLAVGGASRGNMFSGDAPRCSATMSVLRDRERSGSKEYFAYFGDPFALTRTFARYFWDVFLERRAARRQRKAGEEHIDRGGLYPWMRGAITVVMRDLNVASLMGDIVEGVPVVYSTFVGYDEVAHHSGIEQPDAFAVLKQHDAQLARLESAVEQAPRPYHLVVLSDHGQTQGRPFRQRYDIELPDLVKGALAHGEVFAPDGGRRGHDQPRRRADRRPRRGQRRRPRARARHPRPARRRRGRAGGGPGGHRGDRERPGLGARGDRARVRRPRPGLAARAGAPDEARGDRLPSPRAAEDAERASGDRLRDGRTARPTARSCWVARVRAACATTRSPATTLSSTSARTPRTTCAAPTASPTARTSSSTACSTRP